MPDAPVTRATLDEGVMARSQDCYSGCSHQGCCYPLFDVLCCLNPRVSVQKPVHVNEKWSLPAKAKLPRLAKLPSKRRGPAGMRPLPLCHEACGGYDWCDINSDTAPDAQGTSLSTDMMS